MEGVTGMRQAYSEGKTQHWYWPQGLQILASEYQSVEAAVSFELAMKGFPFPE